MWQYKFKYLVRRIGQLIWQWPIRLKRLFVHLYYPVGYFFFTNKLHAKRPQYRFWFWWVGLFFMIFDLLGISDLYDGVAAIFNFSTRPLNNMEKEEALRIFPDGPNLDMVMIDEKARVGTRKLHIIYVSFYTINSWGEISMPVLIHELVHIWQYERFGSAYIALALQAQYSHEKYNYGGTSELIKKQGIPFLLAFNFEQQADIVEDYYRSKKNLPLQWSSEGVISEYWLAHWARSRLTA